MHFRDPRRQILIVSILFCLVAACTGTDPQKNRPPVVSAGADQTADAGDSVQLYSVLSTDPDGDQITFVWREISGETVVLHPNTNGAWWRAPSTPGDSNFSFELKGSDGEFDDFDSVKVLVHRPPAPPPDPCTNSNGPTVPVTLSMANDTIFKPGWLHWITFEITLCDGTVLPINQLLGYVPLPTRALPLLINYPGGSDHLIRLSLQSDTVINFVTVSNYAWLTPSQFRLNGIQLSRATAPVASYNPPSSCDPHPPFFDSLPDIMCQSQPYWKWTDDASGVVRP